MKTHISSADQPPERPPCDVPLAFVSSRTTYLAGPYDGLSTSDRKSISGFISKEDFNYFFTSHCPAQGMKNKVICALFFRFVQAFRATRHREPNGDPYQQAVELLNGVTFPTHHTAP